MPIDTSQFYNITVPKNIEQAFALDPSEKLFTGLNYTKGLLSWGNGYLAQLKRFFKEQNEALELDTDNIAMAYVASVNKPQKCADKNYYYQITAIVPNKSEFMAINFDYTDAPTIPNVSISGTEIKGWRILNSKLAPEVDNYLTITMFITSPNDNRNDYAELLEALKNHKKEYTIPFLTKIPNTVKNKERFAQILENWNLEHTKSLEAYNASTVLHQA